MSNEPNQFRTNGERPPDVHPTLLAAFGPQFAACIALYKFAAANRPSGPPTKDHAGELILWSSARSSKTYQGSFRLSAAGYGGQAGMLNRSLYEDMAIAHWVKRHPEEALVQLRKHEQLTYADWGAAFKKHAFTEFGAFPSLTNEERKKLGGEFGGKTWTGLNLYDLTKDIEPEWPDEANRRLLWQVHDIVHRFNTLLLHQTPISLGLAGQKSERAVTFDVGPSDTHIQGALFGAFWPYSQMVSLVVTGEVEAELNRLYQEHLPVFTHEREITGQASSSESAGR